MKTNITILKDKLVTLKNYLYEQTDVESAAFALGGRSQSSETKEFHVRELFCPDKSDYEIRRADFFQTTGELDLKILQQLKTSRNNTFFKIHTHPRSQHPRFSATDNTSDHLNAQDIRKFKDDPSFVRIVFGTNIDTYSAEYFNYDKDKFSPAGAIKVISKEGMHCLSDNKKENPLPKDFINCFKRNIELLGEEGQKKIADITLGFVSTGGLNNIAAHLAKHLGFRNFILIDNDTVEQLNFNRLLESRKDNIGKYKVDVLADNLKLFDPEIKVTAIREKMQSRNAQQKLLEADFILSSPDNGEARLLAQIFAARHRKILFDMGTGIYLNDTKDKVAEKRSRLRIYIPGHSCLLCQGLNGGSIIPERVIELRKKIGYVEETNESPGSVITLNSAIASIGMDVLVSFITGFKELEHNTIIYDELNKSIKKLDFQSQKDCPICGEKGCEGLGDEKDIRELIPENKDNEPSIPMVDALC